MDRRTFLSWVGVGWLASSLPVAIAACSSNTTEPPATASNPTGGQTPGASSSRADGFQVVGTVADLNQKGRILDKEFAGGSVLVVRNPEASNQLLAVNPRCPHEGCTVDWKAQPKQFVCPCHGSKFAPDGKVVTGPARVALKTYQARIEGDSVLVKAGN
jgi:cytochrome b6-f complex iron-sulfur subunit